MIIASIVLGSISLISFAVWIHGMTGMFRTSKPEMKKVDRVVKDSRTVISPSGISKEFSIIKEKGYELTARSEMSYDDIADGFKRKDPGAFLFVRIAGGFGIGMLCGIAAIGLFVVHRGDNGGWAMVGTSIFFFSLFLLIIINQAVQRRNRKKTERL